MESSIAEFLKRKLACELLPTMDCVMLTGAERCRACTVLVEAGLVCDCRAACCSLAAEMDGSKSGAVCLGS